MCSLSFDEQDKVLVEMKGKSGIETWLRARFRFCKSGKPCQTSEKIRLENSWTPTTIQIAHATDDCSLERVTLQQAQSNTMRD